jgi:hypothetical protein
MAVATSSVCLLAWLAVVYKFPRLVRYAANSAVRAYWIAYLLLAFALTLPLAPVQPVVDRVVGLPDVSYWVSDSLALASCWCMLWYLCQLNAADPVSRHVLRVMAGITVGVIVFLAGRFVAAPGSTSTVLAPGHSAIFMALYRLAFLGTLGVGARTSILLLQRYRRAIPPSELADRLRLMTWAAHVFVAFVLFESLRTVRVVPPQVPQVVGETILLLFVFLLVLSLTTTVWGPRVRLVALLTWLDTYQHQRRLAPLWCALYPVNPGQALQSPSGVLGERTGGVADHPRAQPQERGWPRRSRSSSGWPISIARIAAHRRCALLAQVQRSYLDDRAHQSPALRSGMRLRDHSNLAASGIASHWLSSNQSREGRSLLVAYARETSRNVRYQEDVRACPGKPASSSAPARRDGRGIERRRRWRIGNLHAPRPNGRAAPARVDTPLLIGLRPPVHSVRIADRLQLLVIPGQ